MTDHERRTVLAHPIFISAVTLDGGWILLIALVCVLIYLLWDRFFRTKEPDQEPLTGSASAGDRVWGRDGAVTPETRSAIAGAFAGQLVSEISFAHAVRIEGDGGDRLVIENDFDLVTPTGEVLRASHDDGRPVEALVGLLYRAVTAVHVADDGMLSVSFAEGWRIEVAPDEPYEAWDLNVKGGGHFVCLPGGEIGEVVPIPSRFGYYEVKHGS
jgi:hypothetical protein